MMPQIKCLVEACDQLGLDYSFIDTNHNAVQVATDPPLWFVNSTTSLNSEAVAHLCRDKEFSYRLLGQVARMPQTISYLDPNIDEKYAEYVTDRDLSIIADRIISEVGLPAVVKRNAGAEGVSVFICQKESEVLAALSQIYDKKSRYYDFVALAQPFLEIEQEWRVVVFDGRIELVYLKDISEATFVGNVSPLHWQNARAEIVDDTRFLAELQEFIQPIFKKFDLRFGGLDVARTKDGTLFLLEANTKPGFGYLIRDNGPEPVVQLYRRILTSL